MVILQQKVQISQKQQTFNRIIEFVISFQDDD